LNIVLFTCFIALIEVGCYKLVSESWSIMSRPKPGNFPCCMRHVREYCRYLLCCSVLLGGFERSGGVAGCFKCVGTEAQLVVVGVMVPVDFVLDDGCNLFGTRNESYFNCAVLDVCIRVG